MVSYLKLIFLAKDGERHGSYGARGRSRTGTGVASRGILSPLRLPIPPPGQTLKKLEAGVGIEPASTALQAAA